MAKYEKEKEKEPRNPKVPPTTAMSGHGRNCKCKSCKMRKDMAMKGAATE